MRKKNNMKTDTQPVDTSPIINIDTQDMDLNHDELKVNDEYGADQIAALEGLDAIRQRPAMYVSSTSQRGINQLCWEIIDNSVDEYVAGYGKEIDFHIFNDCSVEISDHGRGIPVGISDKFHDADGNPMNVLTVVLTKIHAGGKFVTGNYKASAGSYGVGQKAVVALSDDFTVTVKRDGNIYQQTFSKGKVTSDVKIIGKSDETGTTIKYHPDKTIFKSTIQPNSHDVKRRISELASLNAGLQVNYKNDIDNEEITYLYEDGIIGYTKRLAENKQLLFDDPLYVRGEYTEDDGNIIIAEASFIYDDETESNQSIRTFANNINTYEGGTHLAGFKNALKNGLNNFAKAKKLVSSPIELKYLLDGIYATISIKVMTPELDGQTKTKLGNASVQDAMEKILGDYFDKLTTGKNQFTSILSTIIDRAAKVKDAEEAARKARALRRTSNKTSKMALPGQLSDCVNASTGDYAELFCVEGTSAAGCWSGDTLIKLADGRSVKIADLVAEHQAGKKNYVFSSLSNGEIAIEPIVDAFKTKHVSKLAKVTLDNGEILKCTPDHRFMLRDGTYKQAKDLTANDSLMPLYMKDVQKKKHNVPTDYITPYVKNNHTEKYEQVHRMVAKQYYGELPKGYNTHHIDKNPQNNNPENLVYLTPTEHTTLHQQDFWTADKRAEAGAIAKYAWTTQAYRDKLSYVNKAETNPLVIAHRHKMSTDNKYFNDVIARIRTAESQQRAMDGANKWRKDHPEFVDNLKTIATKQWTNDNLKREKSFITRMYAHNPRGLAKLQKHCIYDYMTWINDNYQSDVALRHGIITSGLYIKHRTEYEKIVGHSVPAYKTVRKLFGKPEQLYIAYKQYMGNMLSNRNLKILHDYCLWTVHNDMSICHATYNNYINNVIDDDTRSYARDYDYYVDMIGNDAMINDWYKTYNHRIKSVEIIDEEEDVYDLTVPPYNNFALSAGVFVHNSAKEGRSPAFQAVLPLRGKVLNVEKATMDKMLNSPAIQRIIASLGAGVGKTFDINKMRYDKVIMMCFTGDTKVKLLDGTVKTFEELTDMEKENPGNIYWVYSKDESGNCVPGKATAPRITRYTNDILELTLENGTVVRCTPDHLFMLRDGTYKQAKDLETSDSLSAIYYRYNTDSYNTGREQIYNNNNWEFTHHNVMRTIDGHSWTHKTAIHHIDGNYLNNVPDNLMRMPTEEHHAYHARDNMIKYNLSEKHRAIVSQKHKEKAYKYWDDTYNGTQAQHDMLIKLNQREDMKRIHANAFAEYNQSDKNKQSTAEMNRRDDIKALQSRGKVVHVIACMIRSGYTTIETALDESIMRDTVVNVYHKDKILELFGSFESLMAEALEYEKNELTNDMYERLTAVDKRREERIEIAKMARANQMASIGKAVLDKGLKLTAENYEAIRKPRELSYSNINKYFESEEQFIEASKNYNHKIASKRLVHYDKPVAMYDLTVEKYHNFGIEVSNNHDKYKSMINVHNCDGDVDGLA